MGKSVDKNKDEEVLLCRQNTNLHIVDDFVWIKDTKPEMTSTTNDSKTDLQVAQCETIEIMEIRHDEDDDEFGPVSQSGRQNSIEDMFWKQNGVGLDKFKNQLKLRTSNRKTVKECNIIANNKRIPRHPSYYKFDDLTCHILETMPYKIGPLKNVVGKGKHSIVIYADSLPSNIMYYPDGIAVKVYKLGSDVKKNVAILKRVQREEESLRSVSYSPVPDLRFTSRNVIVMSFFGSDQETAPSIDSGKDFVAMYHTVVKEMYKWYNKDGRVHGNLSTRSILYYNNGIVYIGWSHSVPRTHPQALTKLMKDCLFVTNFFGSKGVRVRPPEKLFMRISGLDKISSKVLEVLSKKNLWKDLHTNNPNRISGTSEGPSGIRIKQ